MKIVVMIVRVFMTSFMRLLTTDRVSIQGSADQITRTLVDLLQANHMVVDIAEIDLVVIPNQVKITTSQLVEDFSLRKKGSP